jgi:hypothetical protein
MIGIQLSTTVAKIGVTLALRKVLQWPVGLRKRRASRPFHRSSSFPSSSLGVPLPLRHLSPLSEDFSRFLDNEFFYWHCELKLG